MEKHKDMFEPPSLRWDEYFMRHVYLTASMSKDPKSKIGAVIVKGRTIISEGYNGFPRGVKDLKERYDNRNLKRLMVAHAEQNAILNCVRNGIATLGTTLYTQGIPCSGCAIDVIQAGITHIIVHSQWPNLVHSKQWVESIDLSKTMLKEAGISILYFDKKLKVKGFLDGKSISV